MCSVSTLEHTEYSDTNNWENRPFLLILTPVSFLRRFRPMERPLAPGPQLAAFFTRLVISMPDIATFTLLGAGYFCAPVNRLELHSGCSLDIVLGLAVMICLVQTRGQSKASSSLF